MTVNPGYRPSRCEVCRTPMTHARNGRPRKTCSDLCRQHQYRDRRSTRDRDWVLDRKARASENLLKRIERYRGKVDDTPYKPGLLISRRTDVLFDLRFGLPLRFCQWCAIPMPYHGRHGRRVHCCSKYCRDKFAVYRRRLEDALLYYEGQIDWAVTCGLRGFNYLSKEPQFVLRFEVGLCQYCNRPFGVGNLTQRYCSTRCRQAAWYRRHHRLVGKIRRCMGCLKKFRARLVHQITCGPACTARYLNAAVRGRPGTVERFCPECDRRFVTQNKNQRYCDANCRWRYKKRKNRNPMTHLPRRERCVWCGETLPPHAPTGGRHRQTCSDRCRHAVQCMRKKGGVPLPVGLARVDELTS